MYLTLKPIRGPSPRKGLTRSEDGMLAFEADGREGGSMTVYDKMTLELLLTLKKTKSEIHIVVTEWAGRYGVEERFFREKLVQLHQDKIIRLSAFHESKGVQPLEAWPSTEVFFNYASDANHKRVLLLLKGEEFLERLLAQQEPEQPKQVIGFHS